MLKHGHQTLGVVRFLSDIGSSSVGSAAAQKLWRDRPGGGTPALYGGRDAHRYVAVEPKNIVFAAGVFIFMGACRRRLLN